MHHHRTEDRIYLRLYTINWPRPRPACMWKCVLCRPRTGARMQALFGTGHILGPGTPWCCYEGQALLPILPPLFYRITSLEILGFTHSFPSQSTRDSGSAKRQGTQGTKTLLKTPTTAFLNSTSIQPTRHSSSDFLLESPQCGLSIDSHSLR